MKFRIFNRLIKIDINTCQPEPHWKRQVINRVWDEYKTGRIHCWHVNAIDNRVNVKQMKSKQYPYEVYILRKRVNLSSESSQLYSDEAVNQIRTGRQMLKNKA